MVCCLWWIFENYDLINLQSCWMVYFVTTISFTIVQLTVYINRPASFFLPADLVDEDNMIVWLDLVCIFFYYSMSVQTLTGYGDIFASKFLAATISVTQMLFGTAYGVVLIALALPQTGESSIYKKLRRPSNSSPEDYTPTLWRRLKKNKIVRTIRIWSRQHLLAIILMSQLIKFIILFLYEK